jgi:hypothetical protein
MSDYIIEAVYNLYPSTERTVGIDENIKCYNSSGNIIPVSFQDIEQEAQNLEAQDISKEEAREAIRASALQKLVKNAGLTVEEVKSFINIEE